MSSKRKSPPSKLQEGSGSLPESGVGGETSDQELENCQRVPTPQAPMEALAVPAHSPRADLTPSLFYKMSSRSSSGSEPDEQRTSPPQTHVETPVAPPSMFYKLSSTSSSSGASGSEVEDVIGNDDELLRSPPNKRKREDLPENCSSVSVAEECARYYHMNSIPKPVMTPNSLQALLSLNQSGYLDQGHDRIMSPPGQNHRRRKSGCESPSEAEKKAALLHLNNNSTTLNHNNNNKRTMDDVLKRLTSKMNNSTIREERRPGSPHKP